MKPKNKEIIFTIKPNLTNKLKRIDREWRLCRQMYEIKCQDRKHPSSKYESEFWDRFPELLFDDPEDQHNNLIEKLRNTAIDYFKDHNL